MLLRQIIFAPIGHKLSLLASFKAGASFGSGRRGSVVPQVQADNPERREVILHGGGAVDIVAAKPGDGGGQLQALAYLLRQPLRPDTVATRTGANQPALAVKLLRLFMQHVIRRSEDENLPRKDLSRRAG